MLGETKDVRRRYLDVSSTVILSPGTVLDKNRRGTRVNDRMRWAIVQSRNVWVILLCFPIRSVMTCTYRNLTVLLLLAIHKQTFSALFRYCLNRVQTNEVYMVRSCPTILIGLCPKPSLLLRLQTLEVIQCLYCPGLASAICSKPLLSLPAWSPMSSQSKG